MIRAGIAGRAMVGALLVVGMTTAVGQAQEEEIFARPTPQHEVLKGEAGTWDATMKIFMGGPGEPPQVSKGVETNRMLGGLWLIGEFEGEFVGQKFLGHGVTGYDTEKKKYVGTWVDNVTARIMPLEGTYDAASKTLTLYTEAISPITGKPVKERHVHEYKDEDHRLLRMYQPGPDGKDSLLMEVAYTRRKS